jgi:hypothetical protein
LREGRVQQRPACSAGKSFQQSVRSKTVKARKERG